MPEAEKDAYGVILRVGAAAQSLGARGLRFLAFW